MIKYKTHRKIKHQDICGYCGAKMLNDMKGNWICPNKGKK